MKRPLTIGSLVVALAIALPTLIAHAATPASGTVTNSSGVTWQGMQWPVGVGVAVNEVTGVAPACAPAAADPANLVCDHYTLNLQLSSPATVQVSVSFGFPGDHFDMGVYDPSGNLVGYSLNGDPLLVDIPNGSPNGAYQVVVEPLLVPQASGYTGAAAVVPPSTSTVIPPGFATYHGTWIPGANPDTEPVNTAVKSHGPMLQLVGHDATNGDPGLRPFEPTIGVDPQGRIFINGRDDNGPPPYNLLDREQVRRSEDGGQTWTSVLPTLPGTQYPEQTDSADPYLYVDPDYARVFFMNVQELGLTRLDYSDDGGATWTIGASKQLGVEDHPTLVTAPPPPGVPTLDPKFPKIVYWCTNTDAFSGCARSLDGGRTFLPSPPLFTDQGPTCIGALTGHLGSDHDGRAFIGAANCGIPEVAVTSDGGASWQQSTVSTRIFDSGHDVELAADAAGTVYAAWTDIRWNLPYLAISRDHGATWSAPLMIAPPSLRQANYLSLTAGGDGRVAVSFVGTNTAGAITPTTQWFYYVTESLNASSANPLFSSNVVNVGGVAPPAIVIGESFPGFHDFLDLKPAPVAGAVWGSLGVCNTQDCLTNPLHVQLYAVQEVAGPALIGARPYL